MADTKSLLPRVGRVRDAGPAGSALQRREAGFTSTAAHLIARYSYGIYLFDVPALWLVCDHLRWLGKPQATVVFVGTTAIM